MEKVLLIVDDSKEIIEVVESILDGLFDKIVTAASVQEAQEKVKNFVFSFIILDINLEGRNGAEVIKYLMDNPENENNSTPVVILSGNITEQFIERNSSRFTGVLMKPFGHDQLLRVVKDTLEQAEFGEPVTSSISENANDDIPEPSFEIPFPVAELKNKVKSVLASVKKNPKLKQLFAELNIDRGADNYLMAHIGILLNVSTYICTKLDWTTEKTLEKFVYAAYLHDMALASRPDLARIHGTLFEVELLKDKLSAEDFKLVIEHANMAAKKIDETIDIPADVSLIIRQHHELPKENGFPNKVGASKITPFSTVFIVAHDLTDYILERPNWTIQEFMTKSKAKYKGQHFAKVLSVLNEM